MPAKRHGRLGKAHRPRLDESPFADVAGDPHAHHAMKRLASEADRRGFSLRKLAKLVERKPESLMRSFFAIAPRLASIELICDRMRLGRRSHALYSACSMGAIRENSDLK
jgi:hypothetical protein